MEALEDKIKRFLQIGDGDGYGSGYGDGYGSGYGDGYGDGIKSVNGELIFSIDGVPTIIRCVQRHFARGVILQNDLTLISTYIAKVGNFFAHGSTLREAYEQAQAKALQNEQIEMRIERFKIQFPDINKKIPAMELFRWHHILTGSCEQGRRTFARDHGIDLNCDEFTIKEFVSIIANAYGGDIIRKIL